MQPTDLTVCAVVERDGKYLLTQRKSTAVFPLLWEFPGGRVEQGESNEQALLRDAVEAHVQVDQIHRLALQIRKRLGAVVGLQVARALHEAGEVVQVLVAVLDDQDGASSCRECHTVTSILSPAGSPAGLASPGTRRTTALAQPGSSALTSREPS